MQESVASWDNDTRAPARIRQGAALSLGFWVAIVICGRLIAYDWFDCQYGQSGVIGTAAGCIDGQIRF